MNHFLMYVFMNPLIHLRNAHIKPFTKSFVNFTKSTELVCKVLERSGYMRAYSKSINARHLEVSFTRILEKTTKLNHLRIFKSSRSNTKSFVSYTELSKLSKFSRGVFILSNSEIGICSHEELLSIFQGGVLIAYIE
jgi:ribosomal protein S8